MSILANDTSDEDQQHLMPGGSGGSSSEEDGQANSTTCGPSRVLGKLTAGPSNVNNRRSTITSSTTLFSANNSPSTAANSTTSGPSRVHRNLTAGPSNSNNRRSTIDSSTPLFSANNPPSIAANSTTSGPSRVHGNLTAVAAVVEQQEALGKVLKKRKKLIRKQKSLVEKLTRDIAAYSKLFPNNSAFLLLTEHSGDVRKIYSTNLIPLNLGSKNHKTVNRLIAEITNKIATVDTPASYTSDDFDKHLKALDSANCKKLVRLMADKYKSSNPMLCRLQRTPDAANEINEETGATYKGLSCWRRRWIKEMFEKIIYPAKASVEATYLSLKEKLFDELAHPSQAFHPTHNSDVMARDSIYQLIEIGYFLRSGLTLPKPVSTMAAGRRKEQVRINFCKDG